MKLFYNTCLIQILDIDLKRSLDFKFQATYLELYAALSRMQPPYYGLLALLFALLVTLTNTGRS